MPVKSHHFSVSMKGQTHVENITDEIQCAIITSGMQSGIVTIFIKHTTASVLIIEDEPGIRADTQTLWNRLIPADPSWQHNVQNHGEDNGHSHLRGQLQGQSITVPFIQSALTLGTWQQLVILDFDTRSRTRDVLVQIIGE